MLKPANLTAGQIPVASKPAVGYESRFYVSVTDTIEVGTLEITGTNSGIWNENPDANAWTDNRFVVAKIENKYNGVANIVVTYGTATATFKPPTHAIMQNKSFPAGFAKEVETAGNAAYAKPSAPTVVCNADAVGTKITFFALRDATFGTSGTFQLAGCKAQIRYPQPGAQPAGIRCGRDPNAFVKEGEFQENTFTISAKIPVEGDVLTRVAGLRIIGLIRKVKEDQVEVQREYFFGLNMTPTREIGESMEADMLNFTGRYEDLAVITADS